MEGGVVECPTLTEDDGIGGLERRNWMREHVPCYPPIGLDRKSEEWRNWRHSCSGWLVR